jgi:hypothetical protein
VPHGFIPLCSEISA